MRLRVLSRSGLVKSMSESLNAAAGSSQSACLASAEILNLVSTLLQASLLLPSYKTFIHQVV